MAICSYFLEGRCRYGDRCWNEHPRGGGGRRQEQSRSHYQQPPAGSRTWTSSNQRYVQPSNFSKSTTWTRDNSQTSYAPHSDSHDNRSRPYNSGSSAGSFSNQNRFSTLSSQDHSRETQSDKDGSLFDEIKRDLDAWESSGQWIFSVYSVSKDTRNVTEFTDISPEELRLECYTARDSGNMQNYVSSVQQLASQWKQRIHAIRNTNISSQTALINELTKPAASSAPMFGGQQNSSFPTTSSSTSSVPQSAINFSFKTDSQAPSAGPISSFPSAPGFGNKSATGFSNAVTGSAASFSFAVQKLLMVHHLASTVQRRFRLLHFPLHPPPPQMPEQLLFLGLLQPQLLCLQVLLPSQLVLEEQQRLQVLGKIPNQSLEGQQRLLVLGKMSNQSLEERQQLLVLGKVPHQSLEVVLVLLALEFWLVIQRHQVLGQKQVQCQIYSKEVLQALPLFQHLAKHQVCQKVVHQV
ncbi:unnamed protein product [Staurois parvus]|uniref:Nucleoporin NUP42 n=1 Tax=Staurois parvus TaxID=386267 RepID=A0ABN9CUF1_9NEOB|nr:unnamed protein product [Staurois parvus]